MTFRWPWLLTALAVVPLSIAVSVWLQRRKRKFAVRFASLTLIRDALPRRGRWQRHVPFALLLLAVAGLVMAMARPMLEVPVTRSRTSIILTLDESRSMCSTDVTPNRLAAAGKAAAALVEKEGGRIKIGVVVFSGAGEIAVKPTTDTKQLLDAVSSLTTGAGGTAIGSGILSAIDAISTVDPAVAPSTLDARGAAKGAPSGSKYAPDIVVVLTDGANNQGIDPIVAARQAADRRVRIYTVGFGTDHPGPLVCTENQIGENSFGGFGGGPGGPGGGGGFGGPGGPGFPGGGGGLSRFTVEDQQALRQIAAATGGTAYRAQSANQLLDVFRALPTRIKSVTERHEVSVAFVAAGAVLALGALGLSMRWNRFPS